MDVRELEELLLALESDRVERKRSAGDSEALKRAICSLANDMPGHNAPGVLFVGIEDDGTCAGLTVNDELLKRISNMCSDGAILPKPSCRVQRHVFSGCSLAVVVVDPALAPPVRFNGRIFVRMGPTTVIASGEQEKRLAERRRALDQPFDLTPVTGAAISDMDVGMFREVYLPSAVSPDILEQNQRSIEQQLMSLRMISRKEPYPPTVLGLLTLGLSPREFLPCTYIQFLRIEGTSLNDPIKVQHELDGPLPVLLRQLDELLRIHISVEARILAGDREVRAADYPLATLQQVARNAVMHRNYDGTNAPVRIYWFSDRVEIQSPGGPFGQVNRDNFGQPGVTDYRNPHLAEAMKNLGYVQRFGAGFEIARSALIQNDNPPLEILVEDTYIAVIIRSRQ
ncbi:MAG: putative DNA binding domain-containing protein [Acidobacteria bacterium]|nr:putative DNA binding domain-containing protein [Acidobacteriota bacterium]